MYDQSDPLNENYKSKPQTTALLKIISLSWLLHNSLKCYYKINTHVCAHERSYQILNHGLAGAGAMLKECSISQGVSVIDRMRNAQSDLRIQRNAVAIDGLICVV